jgi:outer membrane protein OmpA-like peptidoglycan-associated protein
MKYRYGKRVVFLLSVMLAASFTLNAQQSKMPALSESEGATKSTQAFAYQIGGDSTKIDFKNTDLMPGAEGEAKIKARKGYTEIEAKFKKLASPTRFGSEFLTYILWAVSTEGRCYNLGEVQIDNGGDAKLKVRTQLQVFSLILTAEPYFAVLIPSELVVLENQRRDDTIARIFTIKSYSFMERSRYQKLSNPLSLSLDLKKVPLAMYQARNAVGIAKTNGAEQYAPDIFAKATASLRSAEILLERKRNKNEIISSARQAIQIAEDARALSVKIQDEERLAEERRAAEEAKRSAREQAEREKLQRAKAELERAEALIEQEKARRQAAEEASRRAQAEAERQRALATESQARQAALAARDAAEEADRQRREAERLKIAAEEERAQLRARLLQQFSMVLETRDTERGLVINMSDVLFGTGSYTLRPIAREKLARLAGILLNYPELRIEAEGHTDTVGSLELNQKLSQQRADAVRDYLISQGIPESVVTSVGMNFSMPVSSNDTAEGRQQNRRVELIVSGEVIGVGIGNL